MSYRARRPFGRLLLTAVLLVVGLASVTSPAFALSPAVEANITAITQHLYRGSQFVQPCASPCSGLFASEQGLDAASAEGEQVLRGLRTLRQKVGVLPQFSNGSCITFPTNQDWVGWQTFGSRPMYYKLGSIRRQAGTLPPGNPRTPRWDRTCMTRTPRSMDGAAMLHKSGWVAEFTENFNMFNRWFGNGCFMSGMAPPPTYALHGPISAGSNCSGANGLVPVDVFYAWRGEFSLEAAAPPVDYIGGATQPTSLSGPGVVDPGFTTASQRALEALNSEEFELVARWYDVLFNGEAGGPELLGFQLNGNPAGVGDPVNSVTGNVYETVEDMLVASRGLPLQFARFYNSQAAATPAAAFGPGWSHSFDARTAVLTGGDVELIEPTGARLRFTHASDGSFSSPVGVSHRLSRGSDGRLRLRRANGVLWTFSALGSLEAIEDLNGNAVTFEYEQGRLSAARGATGHTITFSYVPDSERIASVEDWTGREVRYAYDESDRLASVTGRDGAVTRYLYDDDGLLVRVLEPGDETTPGRERSYVYDAQGRALVAEADGQTGRIELTYQPALGRTIVADSKGNESVFYYDALGHIERITDPDGRDTRLEWDAAGNNTGSVDQAGERTDTTYDADGNVTQIARPDTGSGRATTSFDYGDFGRMTKITDAVGAETILAYDANWNLASERDAL